MITFYICRHGQTEFNQQKRLSGWIDTPLTKLGLENVQTIASKLENIKFDVIYSSDLGRAFITAYLVAHHLDYDNEIIRTPALRENGYGDLAAMLITTAEKQYPELHKNTSFTPPNGESLGDMQQRVMDFVSGLNNNDPDQTILLSAHDGVIKALYSSFADTDLGYHNSTHGYPNDYVARFTIDGTGKVVSFTEVTL